MAIKICGTGAYAPPNRMTNHEIAKFVDTTDCWIRERTGIGERRIAKEETTTTMAVEAARRALEDAGMSAEELDAVIVSTISPDVILPSVACEVQKELGAENAFGFDVNAACTGYLVAYHIAASFIETGACRKVLVIGSECLSKVVNWRDRSTCILFGDGAGATVLQADPSEGHRTYATVTHSDGNRGAALTMKNRFDTCNLQKEMRSLKVLDEQHYLQMDGQAVFKFAVKQVPEVIDEVLEKNKLQKEDIDWYVLHQANRRIVEAVAKRLGEPLDKFPMNMQEYGNTSSASIPILLNEMKQEGKLKKGQKLVMAGFGAGLTWGATIVEW